MKVLVQKVKHAAVHVHHTIVSEISLGYLLLIGIEKNDTTAQADFLAKKAAHLRIFTDENDKMNLSILDVGGEILAVSQFTLAANLNCGNRPGFDTAAQPQEAQSLYEYFITQLRSYHIPVQTGIFQAHMEVELTNDGPCTFLLQR